MKGSDAFANSGGEDGASPVSNVPLPSECSEGFGSEEENDVWANSSKLGMKSFNSLLQCGQRSEAFRVGIESSKVILWGSHLHNVGEVTLVSRDTRFSKQLPTCSYEGHSNLFFGLSGGFANDGNASVRGADSRNCSLSHRSLSSHIKDPRLAIFDMETVSVLFFCKGPNSFLHRL
jgi:hypothetical protein